MDPVALRIGPLAVHWYGLLIVIGAVLAAVIATYEAKRRGEDPEHVWNVLTYCLILGIIGARLYHVLSSPEGGFVGWEYYKQNPIEIIAFWRGGFRGLGIYGAVIGGIVAGQLHQPGTVRPADDSALGRVHRLPPSLWPVYLRQGGRDRAFPPHFLL